MRDNRFPARKREGLKQLRREQMITHTAGFPDHLTADAWDYDVDAYEEYVAQQKPQLIPRTQGGANAS